jgi:hypothetical protein
MAWKETERRRWVLVAGTYIQREPSAGGVSKDWNQGGVDESGWHVTLNLLQEIRSIDLEDGTNNKACVETKTTSAGRV